MSPPCRSSVTYLSTGSSRLSSPCRTARANSVASKTLPREARLNSESEVIGPFHRLIGYALVKEQRPTGDPNGDRCSAGLLRPCRELPGDDFFHAAVCHG